MDSKHTPGPWATGYSCESGSTDGEYEVDIASHGGQKDVDGGPFYPARAFGMGQEQADANARLIAAAPALAEALREVYQRLPASPEWAEWNERARAALAALEGR